MLAVMEGRAITGRGGGQHIWNQSSRRWIDQYLDRTSLGSHQPIIPGIAGFHTCRLSQKCSGTFPAAVVMHECGEGLILREFQQHPSHDRRFHVEWTRFKTPLMMILNFATGYGLFKSTLHSAAIKRITIMLSLHRNSSFPSVPSHLPPLVMCERLSSYFIRSYVRKRLETAPVVHKWFQFVTLIVFSTDGWAKWSLREYKCQGSLCL